MNALCLRGVNLFLRRELEAEVGGGQKGGDEIGGVVEGGVGIVHGLLTVYAGRGGRCRGDARHSANPIFPIDNAVGLW
jgi:hypothetical protein